MLALSVLFIVSLSEVAGVASIMPFLAAVADPQAVMGNVTFRAFFPAVNTMTVSAFLLLLGAAFLVVLVLSLVLRAIGIWVVLRLTSFRAVGWSLRLLRGTLAMPLEWHITKNSSVLQSMILQEVDQVANEALGPALQVVAQGLIVVLLLSLLVLVDPVLAMAVGGAIGGGFLAISYLLRDRLQRMGEIRVDAARERNKIVLEALQGLREVKIFGTEAMTLASFERPTRVRASMQIQQGLASQIPALVMQGLLFGGMLGVVLALIATRGGVSDALPTIGLYAFAGYRLMPALQKVFDEANKLRSSAALVGSFASEYERVASLPDSLCTERTVQKISGDISVEKLSFRFPGAETYALRDISLSIPAGCSVGIVGQTGSGKSTLLDCMLGLLEPTSGEVVVGGVSLNGEAQRRRWRSSIGYVPQNIFLVDDTLAANIAFGDRHSQVDLASVERASRLACLHEFVEKNLPAGYLTSVGDRGVRLSGGQRQRVGIARALYKSPSVLFLDEATSALDNATEAELTASIANLNQKVTTIVVAHRLSTVRSCDLVVVLERGNVVAKGTFDELSENSAAFRRVASMG